jgi:glycosyltransferase involved in cell wall biosynthesis
LRFLIITDDPNSTTGNAKVCKNLCVELEKLGHEICGIVGWNSIQTNKTKWKIFPVDPSLQRSESTASRIQIICRDLNPDVILMHGDVWQFEYMPNIKTKAMKVLYATVDCAPFQNKWKSTFLSMDKVIVTSNYGADALLHECGLNAPVVYEGVDTSIFFPLQEEARTRIRQKLIKQAIANKLNVPSVFIAMLSRPILRKNLPAGIRAIGKLGWKYSDIGYVGLYNIEIVRSSDHDMTRIHTKYMPPKLPKYHCSGVGPLSSVPDSIIASYLQASDLFLMPTMAEGFGLPVLESMACGAVPLVTNCTSMPDLVQNDRGYLVDVGGVITDVSDGSKNMEQSVISDSDLYKKLESAYKNPGVVSKKRTAAIEFAKTLPWSKTANGIVDFINDKSNNLVRGELI